MGDQENPNDKAVINNYYNTTNNFNLYVYGADVGNSLLRCGLTGVQYATSLTNAAKSGNIPGTQYIAPSYNYLKDTAVWGAKEAYARLPSLKK